MKIRYMRAMLAGMLLGTIILPAHASFIRTVNGTEYEFITMFETTGMSRDEIELQLTDSSSSLYGYRYASRLETQYLLDSYGPLPDVLNSFYANLAEGAQEFFDDFGSTFTENFDQTMQLTTADGELIEYNQAINSYFMHGFTDECGVDMSCIGRVYAYALDGVIQAWDPVGRRGADANHTDPDIYFNYDSNFILGSLLLSEVTPVPIPAAAWLFCSGLIGFGLVARRSEKD